MKPFEQLGLSKKSIVALQEKGFEEPTEIQELTIPLLLSNEIDIIAQAQTGTGKTAAFALPLLDLIDESAKTVQALILAPTRELVIQICEEFNSLKGRSSLAIAPIYGGQSIDMQLRKLKKGLAIVVGTPGRILDHIRRKTIKLDMVRFFILDEGDEMLNMGFLEDIESIFSHTPKDKRVLLFSATMPDRMKKLAENYMGEYKHVKTKNELTTCLTDQIYFEVNRQDKFEALSRIVDVEKTFYGLVFCRTRMDVDEVVSHLIDRGYPAGGLHGDISQAQRERILGQFRRKQISILVATDVAARGLDVLDLTHVINYSIPHDPEAYIHRIGRTGRAGKQGTAITFVTPAEFRKLGFIKKAAKTEIRRENVPEVHEIISARKKGINETIERLVYANDTEGYRKWARRLITDNDEETVVAALLKLFCGKTLDESGYKKITPVKMRTRGKSLVEEEGKTRLFIARGKNNGISAKELVKLITETAGTPGKMIQDIDIHDTFSFLTVPFTEAETILKKFRKGKTGKKSMVEKASIRTKKPGNKKNRKEKRN